MSAAPGAGRLRAWLEVLRAPLLLSPVADVLAGFAVATAFLAVTNSLVYGAAPAEYEALLRAALPRLLACALAGVLLLAGGMALNARVDLADDRLRKPGRPLPRGDLSPAQVATAAVACLAGAAGVAALLVPEALWVVATMIGLIALYHTPLKRLRLPGCALLGSVRALDMLLGVLALRATAASEPDAVPRHFEKPGDLPIQLVVVYGVYMLGASLHASTDDESGGRGWAGAGLGLSLLALLATLPGPGAAAPLDTTGRVAQVLGLAVIAWGALRVVRSGMTRPRPATTGALLSGLYLFGASIALQPAWGAFSLAAGLAILALFGLSRLLLRSFAPT